MLRTRKAPRKPAARSPFRTPAWDDDHPDYQRLDGTLPDDHHARWLRTVVADLDLTAFRLSYAGYGSRAYPVELLLAFVLFMYSKGILSPAEWARQARYDDQSKWLLRGLVPSRSQLYTFRDRTEPFVDDWHKQLIGRAVREGITAASRASLDGTFVAALASRHRLMSPRRLDRRLPLLRLLVGLEGDGEADLDRRLEELPVLLLKSVALWLGALEVGLPVSGLGQTLLSLLAVLELLGAAEGEPWPPRLPSWVPRTPAGRRRVLRRYEQAKQRLAQRLQPYQLKKKLSKKDQATMKRLKVSLTDPEAALGWDKAGTFRPLYNVPLVQATDAPLTLAWDVLPRNNDDGLLKPMMEKAHEQLGRHVDDVLVDGAFLTVGEVAWCEAAGITVYGPPEKAEAGPAVRPRAVGPIAPEEPAAEPLPSASSPAGPAPQSAGPAQSAGKAAGSPREAIGPARPSAKLPKKLPKEVFHYDSAERSYLCPQGKRLEEVRRTTLHRPSGIELVMIVHRAKGQDCQQCPQQPGCTSSPTKGRTVKRYVGEEALERLRQRMAEPGSQEVYKLRGRSVELGYADLKEHRGLRVFRCFGHKRARAQAGLVILASNGLKIVHALQRRQESPEPDPALPEKQPA